MKNKEFGFPRILHKTPRNMLASANEFPRALPLVSTLLIQAQSLAEVRDIFFDLKKLGIIDTTSDVFTGSHSPSLKSLPLDSKEIASVSDFAEPLTLSA